MFLKADNYMDEGCFQPVSSCGKYPYIGDVYLQKILILLYILWNTEAAILVKTRLDATFSGIPLTASFLRERIQTKFFLRKSFVTFFSGRFDVHLQVIQPILKFPYLISLIKYPQLRHLK